MKPHFDVQDLIPFIRAMLPYFIRPSVCTRELDLELDLAAASA